MASPAISYEEELRQSAATSPFSTFDSSPLSISERFTETGRRLQDIVWMTYVIEETGKSMLYTESGAKAFSRHPLNDRNEHDTRRIYTELILKHGWLKNVRGSPWAVKERHTVGDKDEDRYKLISSATLVEAAYQAIEAAPDNGQVKQLRQAPLTGIVVFHHNTPPDVMAYLKDLANFLNGTGSKASFVERLRLVPTMETKWAEEKAKTNLKARDSNYNKKLADFLDKYWPQKFDSARDFSKASSLHSTLTSRGLWASFEQYMNEHVVFSTPGMSAHDVYAACGAIAKSLLHDAAPPAWKDVAMHCFKFAVPTDDGIGWLITSGDDKSTGKFFLLLTPMAESAAFKPSKRPALEDAAASAGEAEEEEEEPIMVGKGRRRIGSASKKGTGCKTKAKGKAKAKGKKRENEAQDEGADDNEQFSAVTSDGRTTLLIDDMINAISYVTQHVQPEHRHESAIAAAYLQCLTFVFQGSLKTEGSNSKTLTTWTKVRAHVKQELSRRHALRMRHSDPDTAVLAKDLIGELSKGLQGATTGEAGETEKADEEMEAGSLSCSPIFTFVKSNPKTSQKIASLCSGCPSDVIEEHMPLAKIQVVFRKELRNAFQCSSAMTSHESVDACLATIFKALSTSMHGDGGLEVDTLELGRLLLTSALQSTGKPFELDAIMVESQALGNKRLDGIVAMPVHGPHKAWLSSLYGAWPTLEAVRKFMRLRFEYVLLCLTVVDSVLKPLVEGQYFGGSPLEGFIKTALSDIALIIKCGSHLGADMLSMDVACADAAAWEATWCKLVIRARSFANKNFKQRSPEQWTQFRQMSYAKNMKKNLPELRTLGKPILIQKYKLELQAGPELAQEQIDESATSKADAWLAGAKKEQIADVIAGEALKEGQEEEKGIQDAWTSVVSQLTQTAKSSAALGQAEEDAMVTAIQETLGESLEANQYYDMKAILKSSDPCATDAWQSLKLGSLLQSLCLERRLKFFKAFASANARAPLVPQDGDDLFMDHGLQHIEVKAVGKPGNLKAKLYIKLPGPITDFTPGVLPDGLPKLKLWFAGKVTSVLTEAIRSGAGSKNRILLNPSVAEPNLSQWGLLMTPVPGMFVLQSSLFLPAWNVRVLKPNGKDPDLSSSMVLRKEETARSRDHDYLGEVAFLEWNPDFDFRGNEGDWIELTRYGLQEEIGKKSDSELGAGEPQNIIDGRAAATLLMKGEEDDFEPIAPRDLVAPKIPPKFLKHLMT